MKLENPKAVKKGSRICSAHFDQSSFSRDVRSEILGLKQRRNKLNEDAVPTIFNYKTATEVNVRPSSSTPTTYLGLGKPGASSSSRPQKTKIHQCIDGIIHFHSNKKNQYLCVNCNTDRANKFIPG
ncbi:uncharacterized protein LOC117100977 [Anneissia japonica]|uniref:uncharacterized protein LOC117100977 n=1 Tax=Anneissia japonica TaxID=1529436 RepID=UPI00142569C6|nr:uncharacterized protein LOC117100977 [Anneissia japonica]